MKGDSSLPEVAIGKRKEEMRMVSGQETALPGELLNAVRGPLSYRCQLDLRLLAQECGETDPQSVVITYNSSGHSARSWPWRTALFFSKTSRSLPPVVQPHYPHHTPGVGCCPLRACPATLSRADRKTSLKGERLANLSVIVEALSTVWKIVTLADWYGKEERTVEVASSPRSGTAQGCLP